MKNDLRSYLDLDFLTYVLEEYQKMSMPMGLQIKVATEISKIGLIQYWDLQEAAK